MSEVDDKFMKVLCCNPSFWDYRLPYYKKLDELFGSFSVIYSTKRYQGRETLLNRIPEVLGDKAMPYDELMYDCATRSFNQFTEEGKHIPFPWGLFEMIRKHKPEILRTEGFFQWTPWVLLYGIVYRVPVFVGYERTLWTERNNGKIKTLYRKLLDKFIKGYLVNGIETKKYLLSIGVSPEKIIETGMSADGSALRAGVASFKKSRTYKTIADHYRQPGGIVYLFCGALIERKGVEPLLAAWGKHIERHPTDTLILVGGGSLLDKIKNTYGNEPSIFIEGRRPYEEICQYYAIADVFVLPTIEDNWSLVVPEAMSCGLPVATSIYNGCHPELIQEGVNGYTFDTFDQGSILAALDNFHHVDLSNFGNHSIVIEDLYSTEKCARREFVGVKNVMLDNKYWPKYSDTR